MWRIPILFCCLLTCSLQAEYVVQAGDTLSVVAQKTLGNANRWQEIARLNGIGEPYRIAVGQRLKLPGETPTPSPPVPPSMPMSASVAPPPPTDGVGPNFDEVIANLLGEKALKATWLFGWPLWIVFSALSFLVQLPFLMVGIRFAFFLFKLDVGWMRSFAVGATWLAFPILFGWPIFLIESVTPNAVWLTCGLLMATVFGCLVSTVRFTACSWWQSPVVYVLGQVFGMAVAFTLVWLTTFVVAGGFLLNEALNK